MDTKLPKGWVEVTLGEIAEWGSGGTPSRTMPHYYGGDIPWIKTGDLNDSLLEEVEEYISEEGLKKSSAKIFPKGSVAVAMYGATIGKTALLGIDAATNQACAVAQPHSGIDNRYLFFYIQSQKKHFIDKGKGGAQPNISQMIIKAHSFPLAPSQEQKRIANKLDNLYHHLDSLNERLDEIPTLLKQFREILLMKALTGALTRHWRENHKFEVGEKAQYASKVASTEATFQIPHKWHWSRIGDIAKLINGDRGKNYPHISEYVTDGVPFINTGHINPDGTLSDSKMNFITRTKFDILNSGKTKFGDLVYCLRGATLGKTAVIEYLEGAIASSLVIIRPTSLVSSKYLYYFLTSPFGKELIKRYNNGTAQPNLSAKSVRDYPIPLPSLSEQNEIVERVENLFRRANQVEALYHSVRARITDLPSHILNKAFQGKLVPPYPDDEPASILLQKITQMKTK